MEFAHLLVAKKIPLNKDTGKKTSGIVELKAPSIKHGRRKMLIT